MIWTTLLLSMHLQATPASPIDTTWEMVGDDTRREQVAGVDAIRINNGRAIRKDVRLEDGTIEFDVVVSPYRTFVYLQFRAQSDSEFEEFYFRTHKSGAPDALQYNPVWRGDSFWQLYHDSTSGAPVRFRANEWMHVRVELKGQRAALFIDSAAQPVVVMNLARPAQPGYIALRAFSPAGGLPAGETAASFANVVVRPGVVTHNFGSAVAPPTLPAGFITSWQLSRPFRTAAARVNVLADSMTSGKAQWQSYSAEANGMLLIGRHLDRPRPQGAVVARVALRSQGARHQRLYLGYSDRVTVFVNGTPLFAGDASYSYDQPRQEGLVGLWQSTIWLPLVNGVNEVLVVVSDGFGGWALQGRLEPDDGATLMEP